jgi:hypothetical protein
MIRRLLGAALAATFALSALPAQARPDDERREHRDRREDREDRKYWKEHDKRERKYWKEQRKHERHRYEDEEDRRDRDHGRAEPRRHRAPAWMNGYWRPDDDRRYVALVPGDPSRLYVFLEGRWVLRQVRDRRARLDLEGAFRLPLAPPPIAPPRLGVDLHVVLFGR